MGVVAIALTLLTVMSCKDTKKSDEHMEMDQSEMNHDGNENMEMDQNGMQNDEMMNQDSTEMKMDHSTMTKTFVCPMHPEVTSDKPGECPKCGMDIVEKKMDMEK